MKIRTALAALAGVAALASVGMTATAAGASTTVTTPPPVIHTVPVCTVGQLTAQLSSGYVFQFNHRDLTLTLTNTSWRACTVSGYPGLQLLGFRWQPLPTTVDHVFSWSPSAMPITLYPGQSATATISFTLAGRYYPGQYYPFRTPSAYYLEVTLPGFYPVHPMWGWWQPSFILRIPGAPVRIQQDRLFETALTGFQFGW